MRKQVGSGPSSVDAALKALAATVQQVQVGLEALRAVLPNGAGAPAQGMPPGAGTMPVSGQPAGGTVAPANSAWTGFGWVGAGTDLTDAITDAYDVAARMAKAQARGSGAALVGVYRGELDALSRLPGGTDSPVYLETQAKLRAAERTAFDQQGIREFDLPRAHLQGALERLDLLPFNPTDRYRLEMQRLGLDAQQVGRLSNFLAQRRASGELSEREELEITERMEGLKTDEVRAVSTLSTGIEDRLPALSANRPAAFLRTDSFQLAALRLARQGSPNGAYGAINGAQLQMQNAWASSLPTGDYGASGYPAARDGAGMERLADAINRLTEAILHGGGRSGSPLHPGEATGGLNGLLQSARLNARPGGYN